MTIDVTCPKCRKIHVFSNVVPFRAECEACAADLHVCRTCRFYDRYAENECREDQADPVSTKDRRNLCEYWKPLDAGGARDDEAARARAKLEALFGGAAPPPRTPQLPTTPAESAADDAKRKLEELFRKKP